MIHKEGVLQTILTNFILSMFKFDLKGGFLAMRVGIYHI